MVVAEQPEALKIFLPKVSFDGPVEPPVEPFYVNIRLRSISYTVEEQPEQVVFTAMLVADSGKLLEVYFANAPMLAMITPKGRVIYYPYPVPLTPPSKTGSSFSTVAERLSTPVDLEPIPMSTPLGGGMNVPVFGLVFPASTVPVEIFGAEVQGYGEVSVELDEFEFPLNGPLPEE